MSVHAIAKSFGATRALISASFELRRGEVHALIGENGSGKSTLVKILSGVHSSDSGSIVFEGRPAPPLRTPRVSQDAGIVTVFQEVLVAEARSVLDNIWMGAEGLLRRPFSDRQACGIARALVRRPRVLILDEATSALDVATRNRLFAIVNRLSTDGVGTVFITHRMDEILEIGDRITVMRSGETVATLERGQAGANELVRLMTGADQLTEHAREGADGARRRELALSAHDLTLRPGSAPIEVAVMTGELVGVAGLEGQGQEAFLDALRGVAGAAGGTVTRHEGERVFRITSTADAAGHGIAYVPRERRQALFSWMSIAENFGMPTLDRDRRVGWLRPRRTRARFQRYIEQLGIVLGDSSDRITTLSGGNQQKVVVARWLAARPKVLLLNDPTRGVDVGAKRDLYRLLTTLADGGVAVVMLSSELDEHVELMDRVLVFRDHEVFCELGRASLSRGALVSAFFGEEQTVGVA